MKIIKSVVRYETEMSNNAGNTGRGSGIRKGYDLLKEWTTNNSVDTLPSPGSRASTVESSKKMAVIHNITFLEKPLRKGKGSQSEHIQNEMVEKSGPKRRITADGKSSKNIV